MSPQVLISNFSENNKASYFHSVSKPTDYKKIVVANLEHLLLYLSMQDTDNEYLLPNLQ